MCNDNGSRPGAEAIAIIHAVQSNDPGYSPPTTSSLSISSSPAAYCKILLSNNSINSPSSTVYSPTQSASAARPIPTRSPSTQYLCTGLSTLSTSPSSSSRDNQISSNYELCFPCERYTITESVSDSGSPGLSNLWSSLDGRVDLGVGDAGVIGRSVVLRYGGVEIGRGIVGWGDL